MDVWTSTTGNARFYPRSSRESMALPSGPGMMVYVNRLFMHLDMEAPTEPDFNQNATLFGPGYCWPRESIQEDAHGKQDVRRLLILGSYQIIDGVSKTLRIVEAREYEVRRRILRQFSNPLQMLT